MLHSCRSNSSSTGTTCVQKYDVNLDRIDFTLVDTPGFDDPFRSNEEILEEIAGWFAASYKAGRRLAGIVYLHRITDTRMFGSSMLSFGVFQRMTGPACSDKIVLETTFCDSLDEQLGAERQLELQTVPEFWGSSFDQCSKVMRMGDKHSITQLLHSLASSSPVTLKIQDEMIIQKLPLHETRLVSRSRRLHYVVCVKNIRNCSHKRLLRPLSASPKRQPRPRRN